MPYSFYSSEKKRESSKAMPFLVPNNAGSSPMPYSGMNDGGGMVGSVPVTSIKTRISTGGGGQPGNPLPNPGKLRPGGRKDVKNLNPFERWPRKDSQARGIKDSWHRRFRRKPGRRGSYAIAGKKLYALR